jgi:hypothetical protein
MREFSEDRCCPSEGLRTNCWNRFYLDLRVAELYCNEKPVATELRNSGVLFKTGEAILGFRLAPGFSA